MNRQYFPLLQTRTPAQRGQVICLKSHNTRLHWDSNPGLSDAKSNPPGQVLTTYTGPNGDAATVHGEGRWHLLLPHLTLHNDPVRWMLLLDPFYG